MGPERAEVGTISGDGVSFGQDQGGGGPGLAPPAWYLDPGDSGGWRWWDGARWTDHVAPPTGPPSWALNPTGPPPTAGAPPGWALQPGLPGPGWRPDPRAGLASEERVLPWARVAVWLLPAIQVAYALTVGVVFHHFIDQVRAAQAAGAPIPTFSQSSDSWIDLFVLAIGGTEVVLMIWSFRVATHARNMGYPARLKTYWAVLGWLVPVVSLWFPWRVITDALPPWATDARRRVTRWWLLNILGTIGLVLLGVVAGFAPAVLAVVGVGGVVLVVLVGSAGTAMLAAVTEEHRQATAAYEPPSGPSGWG